MFCMLKMFKENICAMAYVGAELSSTKCAIAFVRAEISSTKCVLGPLTESTFALRVLPAEHAFDDLLYKSPQR